MLGFKTVTPADTGGNVYVFYGELANGNYFLASDVDDFVLEMDTDPNEYDWDDEVSQLDWQDEHALKRYSKAEAKEFFKALFKWIVDNKPAGDYSMKDMEYRLGNLTEEKVTEYRGYSIYRVEDKEPDNFEVWKNGKQVASCESDQAAFEWIDSELDEKKLSHVVNQIVEGKSLYAALNEDEEEYWNYASDCYYRNGENDEVVQKAADYFDVSPSAFDEDWYSFHRDDMIDSDDEFDALDEAKDFEAELKKFETDDYQHRDGDYPQSGKPDTLNVYGSEIECDFKNTSEEIAKQWLEKFLKSKGFTFEKIDACQDGDYQDDWVRAWATVTGFKESKSIVEATGQKIYMGELDRFGYMLTCIDKTKKACEQALMDEYERAYKHQNGGMDPRDSNEHDDKLNDYDYAKKDIVWTEMNLGNVDWR